MDFLDKSSLSPHHHQNNLLSDVDMSLSSTGLDTLDRSAAVNGSEMNSDGEGTADTPKHNIPYVIANVHATNFEIYKQNQKKMSIITLLLFKID